MGDATSGAMDRATENVVTMENADSLRAEHEKQRMNLTSIHQKALARLFPPLDSTKTGARKISNKIKELQKKRNKLRDRRIFLFSEIKRLEATEICSSVAFDLTGVRGSSNLPFVRSYSSSRPSQLDDNAKDDFYQDLANKMKNIRSKRRVVGAHCVSGISLLPRKDDSTFGVRFDIAVKGRYSTGHVAFFRIIKDHIKGKYLRLVQHTLPKGLLTNADMSVDLPADDADDGLSRKAFVSALQERVGFLYDVLHAHVHRRTACLWLSNEAEQQQQQDTSRMVQCVSFNEQYNVVSFQMVVCFRPGQAEANNDESRELRHQVTLFYRKRLRSNPTHVSIKHIKHPLPTGTAEHRTGTNVGAEVANDEYTGDNGSERESIDQRKLNELKKVFIRYPIPISISSAWESIESATHH